MQHTSKRKATEKWQMSPELMMEAKSEYISSCTGKMGQSQVLDAKYGLLSHRKHPFPRVHYI
jgi:hypothetical protein